MEENIQNVFTCCCRQYSGLTLRSLWSSPCMQFTYLEMQIADAALEEKTQHHGEDVITQLVMP